MASNQPPGYGRGGRGAALLAAMLNPPRKPGQPSPPHEQAKPNNGQGTAPPSATPAAVPLGRGALLQKLLADQKQPASQAPSPVATPQRPQATPPPLSFGRGLGRASALSQLAAPVPATTVSPAATPMGRGSVAYQAADRSHSPAQSLSGSVSPRAGPQTPSQGTTPQGGTPQQRGAGDADTAPTATGRLSDLDFALSKMGLDNAPCVKKGVKGTRVPVVANCIRMQSKNEGVFLYSVQFVPEVDSRNMRFKMMGEHRDVIGEAKAFDGAMLYLPHKLPQREMELRSKRPTDDQPVTLRITLVRALPPTCCIQPYNVLLRRIMTKLKMVLVGRHFYDPSGAVDVPQHKLEVWPGYITSISEHEGGLMLLTDVSHRVLRCETVLDMMTNIVRSRPADIKKAVATAVLGRTVLTRYNNRTYQVDDIEWNKHPADTFTSSSGQEMSFVEYYRKAYGKEIRQEDQPLLIHRPKRKDRGPDTSSKADSVEVICLIPELCFITGLSDEIRKDYTIMKDLATHTRVSPEQRQRSLRSFCENINSHPEAVAELEKWGLVLDNNTMELEGRQLAQEQIVLHGGRKVPAGPQADWSRAMERNRVIRAVDLENWMMLYTQRDESKAKDFVDFMVKLCPNMGWQVARPCMVMLANDRTETYLSNIRSKLVPGRTQVVVALFPTSRDDRYNAFKKLCCVDAPVPSQAINSKTLSKPGKVRSVVQKVALQINCKLGGELWGVDIPARSLMVCGIDTYHEAGQRERSVGGFVASTNPSCTRWFSRVCHQTPGAELISGLKVCFTSALKKYHEVNGTLPDRIVVYRDGVGDGQLKAVSEIESSQLEGTFHAFGETYQPKLTVIVVQKRINTRIFCPVGRGREQRMENPAPGTVLDHTVTRRDWYDFFLVSQHVRQGTVTPTHYVVVNDNSGWSPDIIQMLSYKMTHLYYNWPGTVRVPAPCQYAHKLAYQVGQNIRRDPSGELSDRLFYL